MPHKPNEITMSLHCQCLQCIIIIIVTRRQQRPVALTHYNRDPAPFSTVVWLPLLPMVFRLQSAQSRSSMDDPKLYASKCRIDVQILRKHKVLTPDGLLCCHRPRRHHRITRTPCIYRVWQKVASGVFCCFFLNGWNLNFHPHPMVYKLESMWAMSINVKRHLSSKPKKIHI